MKNLVVGLNNHIQFSDFSAGNNCLSSRLSQHKCEQVILESIFTEPRKNRPDS